MPDGYTIISRLDVRDILNENHLLLPGAHVECGSNKYVVFDWPVLRDVIHTGIIDVSRKYKYRAQGDPAGEFNCSEWSWAYMGAAVEFYYKLSGQPYAIYPFMLAKVYGYFTDTANPSGRHARQVYLTRDIDAGGKIKGACVEPQRFGNVRLMVGADPVEIGKCDCLDSFDSI